MTVDHVQQMARGAAICVIWRSYHHVPMVEQILSSVRALERSMA